MKSPNVIARKNLPARFPVTTTVIAYLLLERFHASDLIYGIVLTLLALVWIGLVTVIWNQNEIDIFKNKKDGIDG